jgi:hypothetical protein
MGAFKSNSALFRALPIKNRTFFPALELRKREEKTWNNRILELIEEKDSLSYKVTAAGRNPHRCSCAVVIYGRASGKDAYSLP